MALEIIIREEKAEDRSAVRMVNELAFVRAVVKKVPKDEGAGCLGSGFVRWHLIPVSACRCRAQTKD